MYQRRNFHRDYDRLEELLPALIARFLPLEDSGLVFFFSPDWLRGCEEWEACFPDDRTAYPCCCRAVCSSSRSLLIFIKSLERCFSSICKLSIEMGVSKHPHVTPFPTHLGEKTKDYYILRWSKAVERTNATTHTPAYPSFFFFSWSTYSSLTVTTLSFRSSCSGRVHNSLLAF